MSNVKTQDLTSVNQEHYNSRPDTDLNEEIKKQLGKIEFKI